VVYSAATGAVQVYDFREVAPSALDPSDFRVGGVVDPVKSRLGGLAVGVPGEVAGLALLSQKHGRLSWRRVVLPAAHRARDHNRASGFVADRLPGILKALPDTPTFAPLRAMISVAGKPIGWRSAWRRPTLAATLLAVAMDARAFYRGPIASDLIATTSAAGGVLTKADLAAYRPVERQPLWGTWRGLRLATMPLPSSGGVVLLEMLGILDRTGIDLTALGAGSSAAFHLIAEVSKHGFADRARLLGDSDAARSAAAMLLDDPRLHRLARRVAMERVQPLAQYGESPGSHAATPRPPRPGGTSHVCVIDREGNAVALTTTVNGYLGSKLVTAGGVVLNNQMDDFAIDLEIPNGYGLKQSVDNLVGPGKRPLSSMTPVLIFEGERLVGCVGGSGGPRIISNVFQAILNVWALGLDARAAVEVGRVHHQWSPDTLVIEPDMASDVRAGLVARGQHPLVRPEPTAVQMIVVGPDGALHAASDPRKHGAPAAPAHQ
jgi:gamma-glutamyltranspeptidase/glutathione hydrolase